ncbi:MAG: hypothetical protein V8R43_02040 [Dorea sp.]
MAYSKEKAVICWRTLQHQMKTQMNANLTAMKEFQQTYKDIPMYMMLVPDAANIQADKLPKHAVTEDQNRQFTQIKDTLGDSFSVDQCDRCFEQA